VSMGGIEATNAQEITRTLLVETPSDSEDITFLYTDEALRIRQMTAILVGSSVPSVTWTLRHNTDRSAAGSEVVNGGTTTTNTTSGQDIVTFNNADVPSDSFLWFETTAQSGIVNEISITILY